MITPYDRALGVRTLLLGAGLSALALGVVVITDEAGSTAAMRAARMAAFLPALALVAAAVVLAAARARGEVHALLSLGVTPRRAALGAALGAWALGGVAVALLASGASDPRSLLPHVAAPASWVAQSGSFVATDAGVRVSDSGVVTFLGRAAATPLPGAPARGAALLAIAPFALVGPLWLTAQIGRAARSGALVVSVLACIALLHAVAAARVAAPWLVLAVLPLLVQVLWSAWRARERPAAVRGAAP